MSVRPIKYAPTLVLLGYLGYSALAIQPASTEVSREQQALERTVLELVSDGAEVTEALKGQLRDPFWAADLSPAAQAEATKEEAAAHPEGDPLAEVIKDLTLDATFLQGRDQIAVIDGRIYTRGQRLRLPGDDDAPDRDLRVLVVSRTGVILRGGGKNYRLGYPEELGKKKGEDPKAASGQDPALAELNQAGQAELFQKLLNSPLGAMGKGLLGDAVRPGTGPSRGPNAPSARNRGAGN